MKKMHEILLQHAAQYPMMQPTDGVKLLYQANFGAGHMIADAQSALGRLIEEYEPLLRTAQTVTEDIGGGMMRLYLNGLPRMSLGTVNKLFVKGAGEAGGSMEEFHKLLGLLEELTEEGAMPFTPGQLKEYLDGYRRAGCPMVSHSARYRAAYSPAYRVMPRRYGALLPLIFSLDRRMASGLRTVLVIDGQCGSGKTTIAELLAELYPTATVRMDDFFLPPTLCSQARLNEPGGNIHYERFEEEVLPGLRDGGGFGYTAFDCSVMALGDRVEVPKAPLTIIEGSYSLHPRFGRYYDMAVYVHCPMDVRLKRLERRCNDEELMDRFRQEWIPMESRYCEAFDIMGAADMCIET